MEWLHGSFLKELAGEPPLPVVTKKHVKVAFEVFEHGILKRRLPEGQTEQDEDWKTGHPLVFPGMLRVGGGGIATFQIYQVPLHDSRGEWLRDYVDGQDICARVTHGSIAASSTWAAPTSASSCCANSTSSSGTGRGRAGSDLRVPRPGRERLH